jgi:hypothetical protein
MIRLFDDDIKTQDRQSSKGNQLKFELDNIWYKADYLGYEGLSEYVISKLLSFSSLNADEYVDYELEQIEYNGTVYNGCKSRDFANEWQLITLERLFKQVYGYGLNKIVYSISDHSSRLETMVKEVTRTTGIKDFGIYMCKMLTIDALFLNEDRHTHNIAVMTNGKKQYRLAPIFDNGAALMSDTTMDFPLGRDCLDLISHVRSKTFTDDFYEQISIAEKLYGINISFSFTYNDVKHIIDAADQYPLEIRQRVLDTVMEMRRRYEYLFK